MKLTDINSGSYDDLRSRCYGEYSSDLPHNSTPSSLTLEPGRHRKKGPLRRYTQKGARRMTGRNLYLLIAVLMLCLLPTSNATGKIHSTIIRPSF